MESSSGLCALQNDIKDEYPKVTYHWKTACAEDETGTYMVIKQDSSNNNEFECQAESTYLELPYSHSQLSTDFHSIPVKEEFPEPEFFTMQFDRQNSRTQYQSIQSEEQSVAVKADGENLEIPPICNQSEYTDFAYTSSAIIEENAKGLDESLEEICGSTELQDLSKINSSVKPYCCAECGKSFAKPCQLNTHQRIHSGEKPFSCADCGRKFSQRGNLASHLLTHTREKPFQCSICENKFTLRSNLKRHEMKHYMDMPFRCGECGRNFSRLDSLKEHEVSHTGEKPYSCKKCGNRFISQAYLKRHQKIHSDEKPFPCTDCEKKFTARADLKRHQMIHSGEKPFSCPTCGKKFTQSTHLFNHQRTHS